MSKPFAFPISGIKLKKVNDNIIITNIEKISAAYKKGIRKGNKLISINKDSSKDIDNYRKLLKEEGKKMYLVIIDSEGKTKKIELKLEQLL